MLLALSSNLVFEIFIFLFSILEISYTILRYPITNAYYYISYSFILELYYSRYFKNEFYQDISLPLIVSISFVTLYQNYITLYTVEIIFITYSECQYIISLLNKYYYYFYNLLLSQLQLKSCYISHICIIFKVNSFYDLS